MADVDPPNGGTLAMSNRYLGESIPKLGFGLMRLPMTGTDPMNDTVRLDLVEAMVDRFLAKGFTYFDTAYVYGGGRSETAFRDAVVQRHPRSAFQLADKLPLWPAKSREDLRALFETSMERTGAGYFDFYLLHALDAATYELTEKFDAWRFLQELKVEGKILHAGFSFHDSAEVLDRILTAHPETEFVQLQINYADWENSDVQSRLCYETARRHGKPVIVMEPVRGGYLADMNDESVRIFKSADPVASIASWALRYAASMDGIVTVLSGMSTLEQVIDNTDVMADFKPLDEAERAVVARVVDVIAKTPTIPCTACKYCIEGCPSKIPIPDVLSLLNDVVTYGKPVSAKVAYGMVTQDGGKASSCTACGACESICPQHICIIRHMEEAVATFE
jgi:predicted aldo/keto reductase-like oxidoreductase